MLKIKNKTENIKEITNFFEECPSPKVRTLIEEIRIIQKHIDYRKLKIIVGTNVAYDFSDFKKFNDLFKDIRFLKNGNR